MLSASGTRIISTRSMRRFPLRVVFGAVAGPQLRDQGSAYRILGHMAYDDLRSFLRALDKEGDLKRVKAEVDPYLEVGEIVDRVNKAGGPALLFENVKGSAMPLAMNVFGTDRRLLALGRRGVLLGGAGDRRGSVRVRAHDRAAR
ncbi:3-octaprenyl-4-hydroxybenzoate carboxy-lyase [Streptomyces antimycoticus]